MNQTQVTCGIVSLMLQKSINNLHTLTIITMEAMSERLGMENLWYVLLDALTVIVLTVYQDLEKTIQQVFVSDAYLAV